VRLLSAAVVLQMWSCKRRAMFMCDVHGAYANGSGDGNYCCWYYCMCAQAPGVYGPGSGTSLNCADLAAQVEGPALLVHREIGVAVIC
jgi:hypothetical protein